MALLICNAGAIELLTIMLQTALASPNNFTLHLYQNNYTPVPTSVVGDFTECDFSGYSAFSLSRSNWVTPTIVDGAAQTQYNDAGVSWTCTGSGNTVYGAYVLDADSNLVWGELFSTPRTLANGDVLNYTPVFTFTNAS